MPSRKRIILGVAVFLLLFIAYQAIFRWPADKQVFAKQEKFIASIEARKWGRVRKLTSADYKDTLGLDRETLLLALKDAGSQFFTSFELNWDMLEQRRDGDAIVITGKIRIEGTGGPFATDVVIAARPFAKEPFTFRWEKAGFAPWKWKLVSIHHPDARLPEGYKPGDVRRAIGFGDF